MYPCQTCAVAVVLFTTLVSGAPLTELPSSTNDAALSGDLTPGGSVWRTSLSTGPTVSELTSIEAVQTPHRTHHKIGGFKTVSSLDDFLPEFLRSVTKGDTTKDTAKSRRRSIRRRHP